MYWTKRSCPVLVTLTRERFIASRSATMRLEKWYLRSVSAASRRRTPILSIFWAPREWAVKLNGMPVLSSMRAAHRPPSP